MSASRRQTKAGRNNLSFEDRSRGVSYSRSPSLRTGFSSFGIWPHSVRHSVRPVCRTAGDTDGAALVPITAGIARSPVSAGLAERASTGSACGDQDDGMSVAHRIVDGRRVPFHLREVPVIGHRTAVPEHAQHPAPSKNRCAGGGQRGWARRRVFGSS